MLVCYVFVAAWSNVLCRYGASMTCPALMTRWQRFKTKTLLQNFVEWYLDRYAKSYWINWRVDK